MVDEDGKILRKECIMKLKLLILMMIFVLNGCASVSETLDAESVSGEFSVETVEKTINKVSSDEEGVLIDPNEDIKWHMDQLDDSHFCL